MNDDIGVLDPLWTLYDLQVIYKVTERVTKTNVYTMGVQQKFLGVLSIFTNLNYSPFKRFYDKMSGGVFISSNCQTTVRGQGENMTTVKLGLLRDNILLTVI